MSLEETIAANTAAIAALTAALNKPLWLDPKMLSGLSAGDPTPADLAKQSAIANVAAVGGIAAELAVSETPAAPLAQAAGAVATATITDVLGAASQLIAGKGKPALKAALTSIGVTVTKLSEIPADKLTDALAAIKAAA